ncbi:hypothetical protein AVEN_208270-1 [Araneus ventricosus]|uniref:Uncharacterized protein n=1 Tax=Araneus ventricosus TaxID=182803 RepID=A0A4Y2IW49_ARAVE|nr:hypothetical protein AVEN_208270-1 [Araneus ventricosus]
MFFCRAPTQSLLRPIWCASGARPAMSARLSSHRAFYFISLGLCVISAANLHDNLKFSSYYHSYFCLSARNFSPKKMSSSLSFSKSPKKSPLFTVHQPF